MKSLRKKINAHKFATLFLCGVMLCLTAVVGVVLAVPPENCTWESGPPDELHCGQEYGYANTSVTEAVEFYDDMEEAVGGVIPPPDGDLEVYLGAIYSCAMTHGRTEAFDCIYDDTGDALDDAQIAWASVDMDNLDDAKNAFTGGKVAHNADCHALACARYETAKSCADDWMDQEDVAEAESCEDYLVFMLGLCFEELLQSNCNCGW